VTNSTTTLKTPGAIKLRTVQKEEWDELRSVFPIYIALAKQLEFEIPFGQDRRTLPVKSDPDLFASVTAWLNSCWSTSCAICCR